MPLKDLLSSQAPAPTGLFQGRITRTPGGIGRVPDGTLATYDPDADPKQIAAAAQGLTPQEQQTLTKAWAPLGKGFITVPDGNTRTDIMRHEQLHDLQEKAGLGKYANEIAPLVEPGVADQIKANPVYQKEAAAMGMNPIVADEGSAVELTGFKRKGTKLQDFMSSKMNPQQQRQLTQLTGGE